jgi:2-keto-4-pentenoate hydratase/2-oxohepta-3-ene-1,7-dioic acid hydratase in catechol pathway
MALPLVLVACSDEPTTSVVNKEAVALEPGIAALRDAYTFAQVHDPGGKVATLLVIGFNKDTARAINLTPFGGPLDADVFDVLSALGPEVLEKAAADPRASRAYAVDRLLPAAGVEQRHVATGTNFPEHAKEAEIEGVFNFPKFGPATPPRTTVALKPEVLLDYEVEICARFDRDIRTMADFDAAKKAFFLCGDFTDRAQLMRLVDPENIGSGQGFSDAKSGTDFFPTGPFLVVPRDWQSFVRSERMTTLVNGDLRQDARGREMTLDFRGIVEKALTNGGGGKYTYKGSSIPLLAGGVIKRGAAVMSGTSEGVLFKPPRAWDYIAGGARYIFTGPMFRGKSPQRVMIEGFIEKERRSGRYLKVSDTITHASSSMGNVVIQVAPSGRPVT